MYFCAQGASLASVSMKPAVLDSLLNTSQIDVSALYCKSSWLMSLLPSFLEINVSTICVVSSVASIYAICILENIFWLSMVDKWCINDNARPVAKGQGKNVLLDIIMQSLWEVSHLQEVIQEREAINGWGACSLRLGRAS